MIEGLLIAVVGGTAGATVLLVAKLLHLGPYAQPQQADPSPSLAGLRSRLAAALDARNDAETANEILRQRIAQRDADIAEAQEQLNRASVAIQNLLVSLNTTNARCASLQGQLSRCGGAIEPAYFLALLDDGSVAGPFSRN